MLTIGRHLLEDFISRFRELPARENRPEVTPVTFERSWTWTTHPRVALLGNPLPCVPRRLVTPDGRTTPAATRLEGLLAALTFIPEKHELYPRIERAVHAGMSFLLNSQVKQGEFAGAVPFAVAKVKPGSPAADEFNRRATEIRVDYVQHALSAMVQYHDFLRASASSR